MRSAATFKFSGQDSQSQFCVWLVVLGAGSFPVPWLVWQFGGLWLAVASLGIALLVLVGLRAEIEVSDAGVVLTKRWFCVPYRRYRGSTIEDVWYGGDWGEPDGAFGVVVELSGKEVDIGSRKSMRYLHEALLPFSARYVSREKVQADLHAQGGRS